MEGVLYGWARHGYSAVGYTAVGHCLDGEENMGFLQPYKTKNPTVRVGKTVSKLMF